MTARRSAPRAAASSAAPEADSGPTGSGFSRTERTGERPARRAERVFAARRDASGCRSPSLPIHVRFHVVVLTTEDGAIESRAACDARVVLREGPARVPAARVQSLDRCMRPGCRMRWPKLIE